ncbi:hypothetical protein HPP92_019106 [Vanilla planifolia]|uniref:Uncharacterized protein n=1 Tax=Vanilla planifolia TaxID=51239 RepID=A0A835Q8W6_VANPL|nr:hypothetical protein HPP92_019106 [Vanilla planifolia]
MDSKKAERWENLLAPNERCEVKEQRSIRLVEHDLKVGTGLKHKPEDAADHADLVHRNAKELSSKELEEWQSSMELYEMTLDGSIEDLVKDDRKEIQELMTKRITLTKELDELQKLVTLKEEEIAKNDAQILEVESKVSGVASEFEGIRSHVGIMQDGLNSALSRLNCERDALTSKKKEIDEFSALAEQKFSKLTEIASATLKEARASQDLVGMREVLGLIRLKVHRG